MGKRGHCKYLCHVVRMRPIQNILWRGRLLPGVQDFLSLVTCPLISARAPGFLSAIVVVSADVLCRHSFSSSFSNFYCREDLGPTPTIALIIRIWFSWI